MGLNGIVYVAWLEDTNLVKIGFAINDVRKRVKSWSTGSPGQVVVIKELGGSKRLERELHDRYAENRVEASGREWFEATAEMVRDLALPRAVLRSNR
jgi:hypothetical protein